MELRSRGGKMGKGKGKGVGGGKDMKLRILLASIKLTVYAAQLEAAEIGIEGLAECGDGALKAVLGGGSVLRERKEMVSAAQKYIARHKAGADPQRQLELEMMSGEFFDDEEEPMEEFGGLDLQAEIDALKSDGLFSGNSPDKDSQTSEDLSDLSDDPGDEGGGDASEEEAPPPPKPQPAKKQAPKQKRAKKDTEVKQAAQKGGAKAGGKGKATKGGKGKGPELHDKKPKQSSSQPESKRHTKRKKKGDDKSKKLDAGSPDVFMTYSEKLRKLFCRERLIPTLQAIRTVLSMLFTFYCANWGIAACARWIEYSTGRSTQLSNWFLKRMLMFAMPRPPLYPVPLYLCCNALVDVLEMWTNQSGRFADGSPTSVKVIGISLYACDIGAVLYGGCFLLTGTTHCLALATGKSFEEYLVVDEFLLPRPPMSPLLGYGAVMTGCVVLEQLQVRVEQMLSRRGGFRKFVRMHGVHIVLMFILLPIIGTFLAGISVFLGGLMSDIASNAESLWYAADDGSREDNRPGVTLSRFFGPSFGRDTYIKFRHSDIEQSFRDIDINRNLVIAPSEFKSWLAIQQMQPLDGGLSAGRSTQVADAMTHIAIATSACRDPSSKSLQFRLDYHCYCTIVVQAVEEYYGEAYGTERHAGCESQQARGGGSKRPANLGYTLSCKDEQEARVIHEFLQDHSSLKHRGVDAATKPDLRNYPELTMITDGSERWVGVRTAVDLKTELGDAGLDWRSISGSAGLPWWADGSTAKSHGGSKSAQPYLRYGGHSSDSYDESVTLRELADFCSTRSATVEEAQW